MKTKLWLLLLLAMVSAALIAPLTTQAQQNTRLIVNGDLNWSRASFTLNGSSQTLLAATGSGSQARKAMLIMNPIGNDTAYVSIAGGTATSADIPIFAGSYFYISGQFGPINIITVIGTNTNVLTLYTAN